MDGILEFNRFFDFSKDMMSYIRPDGFFIQANPAWSLQFGWTQDELLSMPIVEFLHPENRSQFSEALLRMMEGQTAVTVENRFRCKNGAYKWISWNAYFLSDQECAFALTYDITSGKQVSEMLQVVREKLETQVQKQSVELKRLRHELLLSERRLGLLTQGIKNYSVLQMDTDGRIMSWNTNAERLLGYREQEIIGESFSRFYLAEDLWHGKHTNALSEALASGCFEEEGVRLRKNGTHVHVRTAILPLCSETGTICNFMYVLGDRTEYEELEKKLSASEEQSRKLFEENINGTYVSTPDGRLRSCNVAYAQMFGFASTNDAMQCNIADLSPNSKILQTVFQSLHEHKKIQHARIQLRHRNGKTVDVVASAIGKFNESGVLTEVYGCFSNISSKKAVIIMPAPGPRSACSHL